MPTRSTHLVTGASRGLGLACARAVALRPGTHVVFCVRDPGAVEAELARLRARGASVEARALDLSSLADVERFVASWQGPIAGLALNAGVQIISGLRRTVDGLEETFAVNHLAHLLLLEGLRPHLVTGGRVVFVGSGTHDPRQANARVFGFRGGLPAEVKALADGTAPATGSERQKGLDRYATSKLLNIAAAHALADREPTLRVFAVDPGLMPGTGLARDNHPLLQLLWRTVVRWIASLLPGTSDPERSGATMARLLTCDEAELPRGRYVDPRGRVIEPWSEAIGPVARRRALDDSLALVRPRASVTAG